MTLSSAVANYGISAIATPTGTNVANDVRIGVAPAAVGFPTADVAYSFKVSSTAGFDVATLTYETGSVAQTTGTPTILDGDGKDFEGVALSTRFFLRHLGPVIGPSRTMTPCSQIC